MHHAGCAVATAVMGAQAPAGAVQFEARNQAASGLAAPVLALSGQVARELASSEVSGSALCLHSSPYPTLLSAHPE